MSYPRYPEYKESGVEWLGEVPVGWEITSLFGVACERKQSNRGMIEKNLLSLSYGRIICKDIASSDGLLPESFETYQIVEKDDIVFRLTDLQNDKRSLRTGIVKERGIITSAYTAVTPQRVASKYFAYLLRAYDLEKVFYSMGGGLRQTLKYCDAKWLPIILPTVKEQYTISTFLDRETAKIDDLIAEQEKLVTLLREKRQAVISHAVTKGLNADAPMKDSGVEWLGEVPEAWEVSRLKFVAKIQTGIAKGKEYKDKETVSVPYLRVANVQNGFLSLDDIAELDIPAEDIKRYSLQIGDVLMNEGGDFDKLGRGAIWNGELDVCIHQNHVFAVRTHSIHPEWLNMITNSGYAQCYFISRSKQSTNLASISSSNLMELPVLLPSEQEQKNILDNINTQTTKIDALISKTQLAIELLNERRSALISAAVTGKIDVRDILFPEAV